MQDMQTIQKDLSEYDRDYSPASVFSVLPTTEEFPDGVYVGTIRSAELSSRNSDGRPLLRITFDTRLPDIGDVRCEHVWHLGSGVDRLGAALVALEFDADRWTPANRRPFSAELVKFVKERKLEGVCFQAKRRSYTDKSGKPGWSFDFAARIKAVPPRGATSPPPAPAPAPRNHQPQPAASPGVDESSIPF